MSKFALDIKTQVSIPDGLNIVELGSILQNFTDDLLYVIDGQLYFASDFKKMDNGYKLNNYDGCFELFGHNHDLYCYRKELVNLLCRLADSKKNETKTVDEVLGHVKRSDPRQEYEAGMKELCKNHDDMTSKFGNNNFSEEKQNEYPEVNLDYLLSLTKKDKETKPAKSKPVKKETKQIKPIKNVKGRKRVTVKSSKCSKNNKPPVVTDKVETTENDVMVQSRINGTKALVEAIRKARKEAKIIKQNEENNQRRRERVKSTETTFQSKINGTNALVEAIRKVGKDNETKECEDQSETKECEDPECVIPRLYKDNVKLSDLPQALEKVIVTTFFNSGFLVPTFYYDGSYMMINGNGKLYSVFNTNNTLNVPRLNPKFYLDYDGTPHSLPVAQFKLNRYHYKMFIEPKDAFSSEYRGPLMREKALDLNLDNDKIIELAKGLLDNKEDLTFGNAVVKYTDTGNLVLILRVLRARKSKARPLDFYPVDVNDSYKLTFHSELEHE